MYHNSVYKSQLHYTPSSFSIMCPSKPLLTYWATTISAPQQLKYNVYLKSPPILLCMNIQPSGVCLETVGYLGLSSYIIYVWICHLVMYVCTLHTDRGALSNITYIIMLNAKRVNPKHIIHYLLQS